MLTRVFRRLAQLVTAPRRLAYRVGAMEQRLDATQRATEALSLRVTALSETEFPGLMLMVEKRAMDALAAESNQARRHVEAAVAAAETEAIRVSREHAEAAVSAGKAFTLKAAREHAEAAVSAGKAIMLKAAREHAEAAASEVVPLALDAAREHAEALNAHMIELLRTECAALRRELGTLKRLYAPSAAGRPATESRADDPALSDAFYTALTDRFRGAPETIAERQRIYLPLIENLADADHPVVDLGCGRGEWLGLLASAGVPSRGVESHPVFAAELREAGFNIVEQDLVTYLRAAPDDSAAVISMFQVAEHLSIQTLVGVMEECVRVLRPGGLFIAETPNSLNLRVAASTFWLDPTHQRPLHPELLQFIATHVGFSKVDGWALNRFDQPTAGFTDDAMGNQVQRLAEMVDGPGDFALLAWK